LYAAVTGAHQVTTTLAGLVQSVMDHAPTTLRRHSGTNGENANGGEEMSKEVVADLRALHGCLTTGALLLEVAGEDRAQGLLELVGPPQNPAGSLDLGQRLGLGVGELVGVSQQRPAGALERLGEALVRQPSGRLPHLAAQLVQSVTDELDHVERVDAEHRILGVFAHALA
jgi:hypothetical protein